MDGQTIGLHFLNDIFNPTSDPKLG